VERLARLRLTLHPQKAQVRPAGEGLRFLGFVLYPTHRLLLRRKGIHFRRRLRTLHAAHRKKQLGRSRMDASIRGWINHVRYADTWGLRRAVLKEALQ
jgi:hypothetical protein